MLDTEHVEEVTSDALYFIVVFLLWSEIILMCGFMNLRLKCIWYSKNMERNPMYMFAHYNLKKFWTLANNIYCLSLIV